MKRSLALALVVVLAACGGIGRTLSGTWSGTFAVGGAGSSTATMSLTQTGDSFVGTWQVAFAEGTRGGSLEGTVADDATVEMRLHPAGSAACPYAVTATWSGDTLSGTYETFNCSGRVSGTLNLQRR